MAEVASRIQRLHALDSLRAIMMLLGLVLHSAITYGVIEYGEAWSLKDPATTSFVFDWLVGYIHAFRMPVFFVIAGFFGALLFHEKSPRAMMENRLSRIVYPFLVFMLLLWPLVVFAWVFTGAAIEGNPAPLSAVIADLANPLILIPADTMHLWFLYYLVFYSLAGWVVGRLLQTSGALASYMQRAFERLMGPPLVRPLLFAAMTFVLLYLMDTTWAEKTSGFLPTWKPMLLYFTFYLFGWLLYGSKSLVPGLTRHAWLLFLLATLAFSVQVVLYERLTPVAHMAMNALGVWCFVFGITGLFIRYFGNHSTKMRFVSDSSYWFYLIHLPLTAFFPGLLVGSGLPAGLKFVLVLGATSFVCWVTYTYLVRSTIVGQFLNGRRYPRYGGRLRDQVSNLLGGRHRKALRD